MFGWYGWNGSCSSLASVDLSGWDTSQVTGMSEMFERCSSLAFLDLSGFDTSRVENMYDMFCGCSSLRSFDLSSFNTSSLMLVPLNYFSGCQSLSSITVGER